MKKLIEWAEKEVSRARKLMLFSTIMVYLFVTLALLVLIAFKINIEGFVTIYYSFSTVAAIAIGFYTGTTSKSISIKDAKIENKQDATSTTGT